VAISAQRKESALRSKRLKRDTSAVSLGGLGALSREPSRASLGALHRWKLLGSMGRTRGDRCSWGPPQAAGLA
jgi:hypothetical protein